MDLNLEHGFIPRIDQRNHSAVERCLSDVQSDLYGREPLRLPWAIVEGPWADGHPPVLSQCADFGVQLLVDTQGWRYRQPETFGVAKFMATSYAPDQPLGNQPHQHTEYVKRDLEAQAKAGASAYIVPGFVPRGRDDDISSRTLAAVETARNFEDLDPRPHVAFVGAHSASLARARELIESLPYHLEGIYLQITPVDPLRDSAAKLAEIAELLLYARSRDLVVIGGRLAGFGVVLRALGIDATDGGLGDGEKFRLRDKLRHVPPTETTDRSPRMPGGRLYARKLMRSVDKHDWVRMIAIEVVRGLLRCELTCCLYGHIEAAPARGREHSLHARVDEAVEIYNLAPGVRLEHAVQRLEQARSTLATINNALREGGQPPIAFEFIENQLAVCELLGGSGSAAA